MLEFPQLLSGLGKNLKARRLEQKLTLEQLAALSGFSKAYLSRLEAGDRQATLETLHRLAGIYGVTMFTLLTPRDHQPLLQAGLISINIGSVQAIKSNRAVSSGIQKEPVFKSKLTPYGLNGDQQAEQQHGGSERAICVYPLEHYPFWHKQLKKQLHHAAFGENFSVWGMTEQLVHIGDIYQVGAATIQVSQPRGTCPKLTLYHQDPNLESLMQKTGYTGFYCRVLKAGEVQQHQAVRLIERLPNSLSVAQVNQRQNVAQVNQSLDAPQIEQGFL